MNSLIACSSLMPPTGARNRFAKVCSAYLLLANAEDYLGVGTLEDAGQGAHWVLRDGTKLGLADVTHWSRLAKVSHLEDWSEGGALRDEDGYPTRWALGMLTSWDWTDPQGWFEFAKAVWYFKAMAFSLEPDDTGCTYLISTMGWSGNEAAIRAMQANDTLWNTLWQSSRVGGHYQFRLDRDVEDVADTADTADVTDNAAPSPSPQPSSEPAGDL